MKKVIFLMLMTVIVLTAQVRRQVEPIQIQWSWMTMAQFDQNYQPKIWGFTVALNTEDPQISSAHVTITYSLGDETKTVHSSVNVEPRKFSGSFSNGMWIPVGPIQVLTTLKVKSVRIDWVKTSTFSEDPEPYTTH